MSDFIMTNVNYYPKVGDQVSGMAGKRLVSGKVIASKRNPLKPAIFSRHGFVGLYILCEDGKQRVINEVCPKDTNERVTFTSRDR